MVRNLYSQEELDFIVNEAKRVSPREIQRGAGQVFNLHRELRQVRNWPRRSRGSIENKLWNIQSGRQGLNGIRKPAAKPVQNTVDSAYSIFRERVKSAEARFEAEKLGAKDELIKAISTV